MAPKPILLGEWTTPTQDLAQAMFPPNPTLAYDQTYEVIPVSCDTMVPKRVQDMRRAAEAHRQVRRYIQGFLKPGVPIIDICEKLENKTRELLGDDKKAGIGFPTGLSLNEVAAHDSANPGDKRVLGENDVCKIDFGTHVNGNIIDSAFTVAFNPVFEPLLQSSKDGTWTGIKMAGDDVLISEVSAAIQEAMESYEIELNGEIIPIKAVTNLGGHTIEPHKIHAGKLVLSVPSKQVDQSWRMHAGECYAIETFSTTGGAWVVDANEMHCNHFMKKFDCPRFQSNLHTTRKLYSYINNERGTLPFCTRWLENSSCKRGYKGGLKELVNKGVINSFPPLKDTPGSYSAQWEHTIYLHDFGKEVLSKGDDF